MKWSSLWYAVWYCRMSLPYSSIIFYRLLSRKATRCFLTIFFSLYVQVNKVKGCGLGLRRIVTESGHGTDLWHHQWCTQTGCLASLTINFHPRTASVTWKHLAGMTVRVTGLYPTSVRREANNSNDWLKQQLVNISTKWIYNWDSCV